jgi:hypothetical protein
MKTLFVNFCSRFANEGYGQLLNNPFNRETREFGARLLTKIDELENRIKRLESSYDKHTIT